jgi:hypothetical protein
LIRRGLINDTGVCKFIRRARAFDMNRTLDSLADLCKKHRLDENLLFVPSYSIGHQIGESLSKSGNPWINLRITTPSGYAQTLLSTDPGLGDVRLIDSEEQSFIIEKFYTEKIISSGEGSYFEGAEDIPGILRSLRGRTKSRD